MPRRQRRNGSSQPLSNSDGSDSDSCFDEESEPRGSGSDTNATDVDSDVEIDDKMMPGITQEDDDHPPEYYRNLEEDPESDDANEDYKEGSLSLIDGMEERFHRYCRYIGKDPHVAMREITPHTVKAFFAWLLNQRRGKGGRRVKGLGSEDSMGTYYKYLRLACERETGGKMFDGQKGPDRMARRMLRKLSKKFGLSRQKREKGVIYVEDLAVIMQTNLTTTKKKYTHGRHRIQLALFLQLAGFSGNRPQAVLSLCYRHIIVTLLRDPNGGPHNILIEFTYEFTKQFLGTKEINTFPVPEVIFDPSLALSPHVALLGLLLADKAFLAPGLTSADGLSQLDIRPGCNQLPLDLRRELADTPVFRKSYSTPYGCEISPNEPLPYSTLLPWMENLGMITGLKQITRPYGLRYGAGNAFNQSKDVSDALQLMMLQHAKMETYIKHYLPRRVTADTRAIVSGMEPQHDLMRAACRMLRWIDPDRPQELTDEQTRSVNQHLTVRELVGERAALKQAGVSPSDPAYKKLNSEIIGERRRQREALLKTLREEWDVENPLREIEQQLSGFKFDQDVKTSLDLADDMPLTQRRLVETIITLPGTTLEEETRRRNDAINAVAAHCHFQEGGAVARGRPSTKQKGPAPVQEVDPQVAAAEAEKRALDAATLLVFKEKRPTICFLCLGEKLIKSFAKPGDLSKHFKRKHLRYMSDRHRLECKVCQMPLEHVAHLRNHALSVHGTVS